MRRAWIVIAGGLLVLAGCSRSLDAEAAREFEEAQRTFESAQTSTDFLLAAARWERLVERGIRSGAVFYNQGNAYVRGGARGRAIASYRLAERYLPRDPQLAANLRFARSGLEMAPPPEPLGGALSWSRVISYPQKIEVGAALGLLTFVLAMVGILRPAGWVKGAAATSLIATVLFASAIAYDWYRLEYLRHGVVTSSEAVARKGAADSYEPAFERPLPEGSEFLIVDERPGWFLARFAGDNEGWLPAADVVEY